MSEENAVWEELMGKDIQLQRLKHGKGSSADMGTSVRCNMRGYLCSPRVNYVQLWEKCGSPFEQIVDECFTVGEGDAIPGLELALRNGRIGDELEVRITSRFAYGPKGRQKVRVNSASESVSGQNNFSYVEAIPPDSDLIYQIEVLDHIAERTPSARFLESYKDLTNTDDPVAMQKLCSLMELQQRKEAGNRWFGYGDYQRAARAYSKGTKVAQAYYDDETNSSSNVTRVDDEFTSNYVSCLNNLAACHLKMGENLKAKDLCVRVLEFDKTNVKALLRAAKACLALDLFEETDLCLKRLLEIAPIDSPAALAGRAEQQLLRQAQQKYKKESTKMASNIAKKLFGRKSSGDSAPPRESNEIDPIDTSAGAFPGCPVDGFHKHDHGSSVVGDKTDPVQSKNRSYFLVLLLTSIIVLVVSIITVSFLR